MTADIAEPAHGSYAGYQWHRRNNEDPCLECRLANRSHQARWRAENPDKHTRQQRVQAARRRALNKLAKLHPHDMLDLYQDELRKLRNTEDT
jgi:hypothetical protein